MESIRIELLGGLENLSLYSLMYQLDISQLMSIWGGSYFVYYTKLYTEIYET